MERPSIKWHGNSIISGALDDTFSNSPTPDSVGALTNSVCQGLGLCYLVKICSWGYYLVSLPVLTGKDTKELKMFKESFQSRVITPPIWCVVKGFFRVLIQSTGEKICIQIKADIWVQAVSLSFWVQISTGQQLSCVQAEALICYMHLALAHCKNIVPIVNISRLLFSNVQEKTVGASHILQLQLSQTFSSLLQCTGIFCASHWDFEVNYRISCSDRPKRIFLVPQLVNQISRTWLFACSLWKPTVP